MAVGLYSGGRPALFPARRTSECERVMWYWGSGYGWGMAIFGAIMMLVLWGGIVVLIVYLAGWILRGRPSPSDRSLELLRQRLAAGEITPEEFERVRTVLQG